MEKSKNQKCGCCGNYSLPYDSHYEICDICGWQQDRTFEEKPDSAGGANELSLNEYKKWYLKKY